MASTGCLASCVVEMWSCVWSSDIYSQNYLSHVSPGDIPILPADISWKESSQMGFLVCTTTNPPAPQLELRAYSPHRLSCFFCSYNAELCMKFEPLFEESLSSVNPGDIPWKKSQQLVIQDAKGTQPFALFSQHLGGQRQADL